ncbi:hypothetical protein L5515_014735 [Caenorhabditis briggsae]|uniref:SEFIR domain-containing protein n=1 Tax=Caenorhabditis briggsae TaxID=6238 RepID=A0AAE9EC90_CAEBR|nr:hypothetical protein L5515_014735 [Caenorhabditis briggsae]
MSPFSVTNFRTFLPTGCPTNLLYFYSISFLITTSSLVYSLPATSSARNASDYVLRNIFENQDQCYKDSFVYVKDVDAGKSKLFTTYPTTKECSNRLKLNDLPDKLPTCPPGLVDLEVIPAYFGLSQLSYPYANLNISVMAHSPVDTIAFRLHCLHASDGSDVYCSDLKDMYINGVKEWPCRAIQLSTKVQYPARFSYACFRLTSYSVYAINATVLPQKCRVTTIVTAPRFEELYPDMLVDPSISKKEIATKDPFWAPMIAVDFSDENAIWIRLGKAPRAECDTINVNVYKEHDDDSEKVNFVAALSIKCPETAIKWENQKAGKYLLSAYVLIRGCKFICEPNARGCTQCFRTHLNLVIHETRASLTWLTVQKIKDYGLEIFLAIVSILSIGCVVVIVAVIVFLHKKRQEANRVQEIRLSDFVKTMLVYADDSELHTNCVKHLVDNLRHCSTVEPIFDLEKLITAEQVVPSRWLIEQLSTLQKFIIVISDCAVRILDSEASETHHLVQSRPFSDLFGPAMDIIIGVKKDATRRPEEARKKYAIARFEISPEVPANLAILRLPTFILPKDFSRLTAFLHSLDYGETFNITSNISKCRLDDWALAIYRTTIFTRENPNWIDTRWKPKDEQDVMNLKRETPVTFTYSNEEGRIAASKKFNLIPPKEGSEVDEVEEGEISQKEASAPDDETAFLIKPPALDDISDSDEDEEEDQGSNTIVALR